MKIARYWKRAGLVINGADGRPKDAVAWGWSVDDPAEAQSRADEAAQRLAVPGFVRLPGPPGSRGNNS